MSRKIDMPTLHEVFEGLNALYMDGTMDSYNNDYFLREKADMPTPNTWGS